MQVSIVEHNSVIVRCRRKYGIDQALVIFNTDYYYQHSSNPSGGGGKGAGGRGGGGAGAYPVSCRLRSRTASLTSATKACWTSGRGRDSVQRRPWWPTTQPTCCGCKGSAPNTTASQPSTRPRHSPPSPVTKTIRYTNRIIFSAKNEIGFISG